MYYYFIKVFLFCFFLSSEEEFRNRLLNIDRENMVLKRKIDELEGAVAEKDTEIQRMSKRMRSIEKSHDMLTKTNAMYAQERFELEREVSL